MIRIEHTDNRQFLIEYETGQEFQYILLLKKLIEHRNKLEKRRDKE